jgi:hypothetical protein
MKLYVFAYLCVWIFEIACVSVVLEIFFCLFLYTKLKLYNVYLSS